MNVVYPWFELSQYSFIRCCTNNPQDISTWVVNVRYISNSRWRALFVDRENQLELIQIGNLFHSIKRAKAVCDRFLRRKGYKFVTNRLLVML